MDMSLDDGEDLSDPEFLERSGEELGSDQTNVLHLSPQEVFARLERGWMNEKLAPELLPPLEQEKDAMLRQIKVMERNIATLDRKDMRTDIHKLELERLKFIVASYMRVRLFKLQELSVYYYDLEMKRNHRPSYLIPEEFAFLKTLIARTEEYYRTTLLSKMPLPHQKFDVKKFKRLPPLDAFVFFRVQEASVIDVQDSQEKMHELSLGEGEQHIARYLPVAKLFEEEGLYLV